MRESLGGVALAAALMSGYGRELSELGFGEFTNRKLINAFPAGSPAAAPRAV